jgi:hypothetical protein
MFLWFSFCRADAEDIYIDVYRGRTFKHSSAYSIYPSLRELRTHSVDFILRFYLRAFSSNIMIHYTDMEFSVYETRSLCSMYPQDHNMISRYAERCIKLGIHLEDAIQLLQVCRPLQKRIHFAILLHFASFYINICITVFLVSRTWMVFWSRWLGGALHQ